MPTYEVACATCGDLRWPTLPERPTAYVCTRCLCTPLDTRIKRREAGRRRAVTRLRNAARKEPAQGVPR